MAILPITAVSGTNNMDLRALDCRSRTIKHEVGQAMWWVPSKAMEVRGGVINLEGEIHLDKDLKPSSIFALLSVEVSLWLS